MQMINLDSTVDLIEALGVAAFLGELHEDDNKENPRIDDLMKEIENGMTMSRFDKVCLEYDERHKKALVSSYLAGRHNARKTNADAHLLTSPA